MAKINVKKARKQLEERKNKNGKKLSEEVIKKLKSIDWKEINDFLELGLDKSKQGKCPSGHESEGGKCFSFCSKYEDPMWKCFHEGCETGGKLIDNIQVTMLKHKISFREACILMIEHFKPELLNEINNLSPEEYEDYMKAKEEQEQVYKCNQYIAKYYQKKLKETPAAIEYLKTRGFTEEEIFNTQYYWLGYAPENNRKIFEKLVEKFSIKTALGTGLFKCEELEADPKKDINDIDISRVKNVFFGVVTVGYVEAGQIKYFCRRAINKDARPKILKAKTDCNYSKVKNIIFGKDSLSIKRPDFRNSLIIAEGLFDATSLLKREYPCISTITTTFSEEQIPELRKITRNKNIYICQDVESSQAGITGALKMALAIIDVAAEVRIVTLPLPQGTEKIDVNDYFEKYSHTIEDFQGLINESQTITDYYIQHKKEDLKEYAEVLLNKIEWNSGKLAELKRKFEAPPLFAVLNSLDDISREDLLEDIKEKFFPDKEEKFHTFMKGMGIEETDKEAMEEEPEKEEPEIKIIEVKKIRKKILKIQEDKKDLLVTKTEKIRKILLRDLANRGKFYVDENRTPYYFNSVDKVLMEVSFADKEFLLFLGKRGLVKEEKITKILIQHIENFSLQCGRKVEIQRDWYYDYRDFILYINLRNKQNQIVKITPEEVEIVDNGTDGVMFLTSKYDPLNVDLSLKDELFSLDIKNSYLRKYVIDTVNFDDEDSRLSIEDRKALLWLYYYSIFFTSKTIFRNKPILLLYGEKGSGKTLLIQFIGKLLFGEMWDMEIPSENNQEAIDVAVTHRSFLGLDNVDNRIRWIEDWLCSVATGRTITKRKLFTTNDEEIFKVNSFVAVTARTPKFRRDDVADRLIILKLKRFDVMTPAAEVFKNLKKYRTEFITETVFTLQKILQQIKKYEGKVCITNFRQGDFVNFCYKVMNCQDDVLNIFKKMEQEQLEYAEGGELLVDFIEDWLNDDENNNGKVVTAKQLFSELRDLADQNKRHKDFYFKSSRMLAQKIKTIKKVLELNFEVDIKKEKDRLTYSFAEKKDRKNAEKMQKKPEKNSEFLTPPEEDFSDDISLL